MTENSDAPDVSNGAPVSSVVRLALLVVLSLAVILSLGTFVGLAVTGAVRPTAIFDGAAPADSSAKDRQQVMAQTQLFITRVNTYGPDLLAEDGTMPDYRDQVVEVITSKLAASFEETVTAAEATVAQAGFGRTTEVFGVGVSTIDKDSATALVAGAFTSSYPKNPEDLAGAREDDPRGPLPFRIEVKLVKVEGEWLVDSFVPVADVEGKASESPSESPSESSTGSSTGPPSGSPSAEASQ